MAAGTKHLDVRVPDDKQFPSKVDWPQAMTRDVQQSARDQMRQISAGQQQKMAGNAQEPGGTQHNTQNGGLLGARAGADIGLSSTFSVTERSECSRCKRSLRVGGNSARASL
jgi:hypothetical protein